MSVWFEKLAEIVEAPYDPLELSSDPNSALKECFRLRSSAEQRTIALIRLRQKIEAFPQKTYYVTHTERNRQFNVLISFAAIALNCAERDLRNAHGLPSSQTSSNAKTSSQAVVTPFYLQKEILRDIAKESLEVQRMIDGDKRLFRTETHNYYLQPHDYYETEVSSDSKTDRKLDL